MSRKTLLILTLVLVPVAVIAVLASTGWATFLIPRFPNATFVIAFTGGATATVLLSVGLFALVFISSRRGFDDRTLNGQDDQTGNQQDSDGT